MRKSLYITRDKDAVNTDYVWIWGEMPTKYSLYPLGDHKEDLFEWDCDDEDTAILTDVRDINDIFGIDIKEGQRIEVQFEVVEE